MFLAGILSLVTLEQNVYRNCYEFFLMLILEISEIVGNSEGEVFLSDECYFAFPCVQCISSSRSLRTIFFLLKYCCIVWLEFGV